MTCIMAVFFVFSLYYSLEQIKDFEIICTDIEIYQFEGSKTSEALFRCSK
jgi:hypothetical protein